MAGGAQDSDDAITGINVTPLVDIFLVVLIIFMVTANFIANRTIPLDLPKAATGTDQVQTVFSVVLAANGVTQVDANTVPTDDAVFPLAQQALKANPDMRAVIKADAAVPHGRVIHVLDLLKQAHISKIAFANAPAAPMPGSGLPGSALPGAPAGATP